MQNLSFAIHCTKILYHSKAFWSCEECTHCLPPLQPSWLNGAVAMAIFGAMFFLRSSAIARASSLINFDRRNWSTHGQFIICIAKVDYVTPFIGNGEFVSFKSAAFDESTSWSTQCDKRLRVTPIGTVFGRNLLTSTSIDIFATEPKLPDVPSLRVAVASKPSGHSLRLFKWQPWRARRQSLLQVRC